MKTKIILFLFIAFLLNSCQGQTAKEVQTIDAKLFAEKLKATEKIQLLDVRTSEEFTVEHLENASNINWNGNDFIAKVQKLDKSKPVFVYCKVGGRSSQAANKLSELGFKEVYNLDGGIMKWQGKKVSVNSTNPIGMSSEEYQKLIYSESKVIINFYAKWCEPCKKMEPYILKMQTELKETKGITELSKTKTSLVRLNADENKTLLDSMKLDGLPVILIYENGKEVWRNIGYLTEEELRIHL